MDLESSPRDIDCTHRIGVPNKGKNKPVIINFGRYMDWKCIFSNQKRLKGKNIAITESLRKIRMSGLKKARSKFGYSSVWTADRRTMYKVEGNTKAKVCFD